MFLVLLHHLKFLKFTVVYTVVCTVKWSMFLKPPRLVHPLQAAAQGLGLIYITGLTNVHVFPYSMYQHVQVPNLCSQQWLSIQSEQKIIHACQSHVWCCAAASRHKWTPHHIILHKCQERWGQWDPVCQNCRAQNFVRGLFSLSFFQLARRARQNQEILGYIRHHCDSGTLWYLSVFPVYSPS